MRERIRPSTFVAAMQTGKPSEEVEVSSWGVPEEDDWEAKRMIRLET